MSLLGKSGYQETACGWIPTEWKATQIGEMTEVSAGGTPATGNEEYWNPPEVPWMSSGEVRLRRIHSTEKKISYLGLKNSAAKIFPKKSIVMALAGQGKTRGCVAVLESEVATNQSLAAIYPSDQFETDFLFHNLDWRYKELRSLSSGEGGRGGLNLSIIKSVPIGLPPIPEQQKIAAILTAVDDKLNIIARQIVATQSLKRGLMQTLFSRGVGIQNADGRWVPHTEFINKSSLDIPAVWNVRRLGDIAPLIRRPVDINPDSAYPEVGLRSYGKGTFHKPALLGKEVGNKRLFEIKAGDLLFSNVFAWEGAVAVAKREDDGRFGSHRYMTCVVNKSQADTSYVFRYLTTPSGIASLTLASPGGAGRNKTLGLGALANITIPLPPLIEQQKISQILDGVDAKLEALELRRTNVETLKRGLMQKLLTGEWRVNVSKQ
ncbi:restriction endonuclease subunit S [Massilia soli]|uniref:Restriction endonuclease subunit S n=1 Tax=Massilia soli TaxID=2792854 RepID=A0ABS7SKG1_9BURK|nr:restriction endonuclease subunit S [Massilia soli]MBZ2206251.1 restriction endonuclease subunit S [Massilia soli]